MTTINCHGCPKSQVCDGTMDCPKPISTHRDYVAIVGFTDTFGDCVRFIEIHSCLNFVQAVEIAILSINDNGAHERIIEVKEADFYPKGELHG